MLNTYQDKALLNIVRTKALNIIKGVERTTFQTLYLNDDFSGVSRNVIFASIKSLEKEGLVELRGDYIYLKESLWKKITNFFCKWKGASCEIHD